MRQFILIGLGNPGKKYQATRHNAGKMFAKWLSRIQLQKDSPAGGPFEANKLEAIESESFMNSSGDWVYSFYKNYNHDKDYSYLLIVHDDLDLPLGQFKIQFGHGPHEHKGLLSIYQSLGTKNFWHVRIGIDNRELKAAREAGETYTLKPFSKEEKKILMNTFTRIQSTLTGKLNF